MAWAPDYITTDELKDYVRVGDAVDDVELELAVTAASRAVDYWCNRQFGSAAGARTYTAHYDGVRGVWVAEVDDLMDSTGLTVSVDGSAVTDYDLEPGNAAADGKPWTRLVFGDEAEADPDGTTDQISVAADPWGWTEVPGAVALATKLQASRFASRRDSPYGVAGSPADGSELRLLARVDPDVAVALRSYVRPRRAG